MPQPEASAPPRPGLRERKRAKTRNAIQAHAIRLFTDRGYDATSIDDIAEAAEVSRSTVLRYFPSKTDLVIRDDFDELMIAAFRAQPKKLNAVQALKASFHDMFALASLPEGLAQARARDSLARTVPELRAAMVEELTRTIDEFAALIAERSDRKAQDDEVIALAGAVIGITVAAWLGAVGKDWLKSMIDRLDAGFRLLESGFSL